MKTLEITEVPRISGYGDYIAVDLVHGNKVLSTPFYLQRGKIVSATWNTPASENHTPNPMTETFQFKLNEDGLFVRWADGPMGDHSTWDKTNPKTLPDFRFRYAFNIKATTLPFPAQG